MKPVDAALHYADFARGEPVDNRDFWRSDHPRLAPGDKAIALRETETRPHKCMQILAAEVRRLRSAESDALAVCRAVIFAQKQAARHRGDYSIEDLRVAESLAAAVLERRKE